jgi:hypothetical protein
MLIFLSRSLMRSDSEPGISLAGLRELEIPLEDGEGKANLQEVMNIWGRHCGRTVEFWKGDLREKRTDRKLTMKEIVSLFEKFRSLRVAHFVYADGLFLGEEDWRAGMREDCLTRLASGVPSLEEIRLESADESCAVRSITVAAIRRDGDRIGVDIEVQET